MPVYPFRATGRHVVRRGDGDPDILFLAGSLGVVENNTKGRRPTH